MSTITISHNLGCYCMLTWKVAEFEPLAPEGAWNMHALLQWIIIIHITNVHGSYHPMVQYTSMAWCVKNRKILCGQLNSNNYSVNLLIFRTVTCTMSHKLSIENLCFFADSNWQRCHFMCEGYDKTALVYVHYFGDRKIFQFIRCTTIGFYEKW